MRKMMKKSYLKEIVRQIQKLGYECRLSNDKGNYCDIYQGEYRVCILYTNGELIPNSIYDLTKAVIDTCEYLDNYEKASVLDILGLYDEYRKLLEFNGYVLAMKKMKSRKENDFVVWQYSKDHMSVNYGEHYSDYIHAKEEFALRSGLISRSKIFSEKQLKLIYTNLMSFAELSSNIDRVTERGIGYVLDRIGDILPEMVENEVVEKHEEVQTLILN